MLLTNDEARRIAANNAKIGRTAAGGDIVGGLLAGWLLPQIGMVIGAGSIAAIINAFIAVILLIVLRLVRRAT
jgi:uncharacterized membrane protein YeaQ/YmgE (transglycosylase-associated protein family)